MFTYKLDLHYGIPTFDPYTIGNPILNLSKLSIILLATVIIFAQVKISYVIPRPSSSDRFVWRRTMSTHHDDA